MFSDPTYRWDSARASDLNQVRWADTGRTRPVARSVLGTPATHSNQKLKIIRQGVMAAFTKGLSQIKTTAVSGTFGKSTTLYPPPQNTVICKTSRLNSWATNSVSSEYTGEEANAIKLRKSLNELPPK